MSDASSPDPVRPFGDSHGPMLSGPFAPIADESVLDGLEVTGEVPKDLRGAYFRNGPNPRFEPVGKFHPFDGDAMIHGAYFDGGQVQIRNRWVRTAGLEENLARGAEQFNGILHTIKESPDKRLKDTANTDVTMFNGELLATWYMSGAAYRIDPFTLETLGTLPRELGNISAHAKTDPRNGDLVFFDYAVTPPYMRFGVLAASGEVKKLVDVELPGPRMPHDMALTEHYGVLHDFPLLRDEAARQNGRHKLRFESKLMTRFGVIPRAGDAPPRWFTFEPTFIYHVINAWEEGDEVVMLACRFIPRFGADGAVDDVATSRYIAELNLDARPWVYRMNLKTGATKEHVLNDEHILEFPTVDPRRVGVRTRYGYLVDHNPHLLQWYGLKKLDLESGAVLGSYSQAGMRSFYSEPWFAPRDGSTAEDDGYLIAFHLDAETRHQELQVFDARGLGDGPVARVHLPRSVSTNFHAVWALPHEMRRAS